MANQVEITRQQIASHNATSTVGAEIMAPLNGQRDNQRVLATSSIASQLTDSLEEMGMSVATLTDKRTLGQRQARKGQGASLDSLAKLTAFYDKLPDMPKQEHLRQLIGRLQSFQASLNAAGRGMASLNDILQMLDAFNKDVTHQYAALVLVRDFFRKRARRRAAADGDAALSELLDEAVAAFEQTETMRDVQAGFAAAGIAHKQAPVLGTDPASIRESYRELIRETKNFGQLFDSLTKYDLRAKFEDVVETFVTAAGHDLSSAGPSIDPVLLGDLLKELGKLKKLKSVYESMGEMITVTSRSIAELHDRLNQTELSSKLFHYCSRATVGLTDAKKLVAGLDDTGPLAPLAVANGLFDLHRQVPDEVMPAVGAKLKQNSTLRSLLDTLVAAEEQAYASSVEAMADSDAEKQR
jgi:type III secretion system YopN/LcrE/InvE/MxiC family regulator